ncbi:AAA domain-containing protein, partial [Phascolomyces articulosus]
LVLTDEKGYNIDKKFSKTGEPSEGDEVEFDGHIVTVESYTSQEPYAVQNMVAAAVEGRATPTPAIHAPMTPQPHNVHGNHLVRADAQQTPPTPQDSSNTLFNQFAFDDKAVRAPSMKRIGKRIIQHSPPPQNEQMINNSPMEIDNPTATSIQTTPSSSKIINNISNTSSTAPATSIQIQQPQRRVRVGLSKRTNNAIHNDDSNSMNDTTSNSFSLPKTMIVNNNISIPIVLQFPTKDKALSMASNRVHLKRTKIVPTTFRNHTQYRDVYQKIIHEHLQILLLNYGVFFYMIHKTVSQKPSDQLERNFRSKGLGFYASCEMQSTGRVTSQDRYRLKIRNREHHSKYGKDDIWVISKNSGFDAQYTFLAKSTFYGPFSDGYLEVECLTARDTRVASRLLDDRAPVYALRSVSASNEYMMLDALQDKLEKLPLLPYILYDDKKRNKKTKNQDPLVPIGNLEFIRITREDNIDIGQKLHETIQRYHLNDDQQSVLRQVAKSVIVAPNWSEKPDSPVTLVHGVFGSGKRYYSGRYPGHSLRLAVTVANSSFICLSSLDKLGYDSFVRVGSLKKIAKSILPYTIRAKSSSNEELKELEQMLEDPLNSEEDIELIASTIQKFRRSENTMQLQNMDVVGTTCMASTFDIFGNTSFSLALVDEASQLTEPISMVPLTRFSCSRLIMIGDPLQLPPTVTTTAEEGKAGQGLDKTLFDRMTECHPDISSISNHLFYSRQLLDGISNEDRKPLIDGLPSLMFVDVGGQEQRNLRSNSFWNETEASIATYVIDALMALSISPSDIGVITLYKEQADKMIEFIGNNQLEKKQSVQVSTVDAFQGGEKEVIILSTVRTTNSSFIDNYPRVNVAVTRARRHLIILGKQTLLLNNDLWGNIVMRCQGMIPDTNFVILIEKQQHNNILCNLFIYYFIFIDNSLTGHDFAQLLKRLQLTNDSSIH